MKHITLNKNTSGRDLLLADVNGCVNELYKLIDEVNFSEDDRLFLLGNSINKGLYSYEVVQFTKNKNVYPLLGNAEMYMLTALTKGLPAEEKEVFTQQWDDNGGTWRHNATPQQLNEMYNEILQWPLSVTINSDKKYGLVHAESPFDDWNEFINASITYNIVSRATNGQTILQGERTGQVSNVDTVVSGHTQLARPPVSKGKCIYINHGIVIGKKAKVYDISML